MDSVSTAWVSRAARLPVAFSQVREDALLDLEVCRRLPDGFEGILIASGGCTAAYLAARCRASRLHLVDMNPAQIALTRLKLRLLETCEPDARLAILGHTPMPAAARAGRLAPELASLGLQSDCFGPVDLLGSLGPDHMGRYEVLFSKLREELSAFATEISDLLSLDDKAEQSRRTAPSTPLGAALDQVFDRVMALPILVELFGDAATQNRVVPFSRHFASRTRHVLATLPAASYPYLAQMLLGRFADGCVSPWLSEPPTISFAKITLAVSSMTSALAPEQDQFDLVHLSNILDWLSPGEARATLELAWKALRRGGLIVIRQLNSTLSIPELDTRFEWLGPFSAHLHAADRSFFYRAIHVGRKP